MKGLKKIFKAISDTNVGNVKVYKTKTISPFFDYAIVVTATSSRQMQAVVSHLKDEEKTGAFKIKGVEGKGESSWVLIDMYDYIVNVFLESDRNIFGLDEIWAELPQVDFE